MIGVLLGLAVVTRADFTMPGSRARLNPFSRRGVLGLKRIVSFIANGTFTYTVTPGTTVIEVECIGAGGGGGGSIGSVTAGACGSGAGGGAYAKKVITSPAATYTVTIGKGGTGVSGANGTDGTSTTFGTGPILTAPFGQHGFNDAGSAGFTITAGGVPGAVATGGDVNTGGMPGLPGIHGLVQGTGASGVGGGGLYGLGGGAAVLVFSNDGNLGKAPGAGGSGAASFTNSTHIGGAGVDGACIIHEYS